jgi:hypothetical protein
MHVDRWRGMDECLIVCSDMQPVVIFNVRWLLWLFLQMTRFIFLVCYIPLTLCFLMETSCTTLHDSVKIRVNMAWICIFHRDAMETEMQALLATNQSSFLVHFLHCSSTLDTVPLQKATRMCPDIPVLILAHSEGLVKARCCVPEVCHCLLFHICLRKCSHQLYLEPW